MFSFQQYAKQVVMKIMDIVSNQMNANVNMVGWARFVTSVKLILIVNTGHVLMPGSVNVSIFGEEFIVIKVIKYMYDLLRCCIKIL